MNNIVQSYESKREKNLTEHLSDLDKQCVCALEYYRSLVSQRAAVLEVIGIRALQTTAELITTAQIPPLAIVA